MSALAAIRRRLDASKVLRRRVCFGGLLGLRSTPLHCVSMDFTLNQLRGFVAVAEELHFGRAAERLHMTQPPLTRQIQTLERVLAAPLLDRGGRQVALTPAGVAFLAEARRILMLVDAAPVAARRVAAGQSGTLRLGFTANAAYALLGELLDRTASRLPQVHVALQELVSEDQFRGLASGTLDIGIVRAPVPEDLASTLAHTEDLILAIPAQHTLGQQNGPVALSEVTDDYTGFSPEGSQHLYNVCAALVGVADFMQEQITSQVPTMLALVRAGRGFALVPRSCAAMRVEGVVFRELDRRDARDVSLHLCWSPDSANPIVQEAIAAIQAG